MNNQLFVVAITGASGAIYGKILLDTLKQIVPNPENIGIIMSDTAKKVWEYELNNNDYKLYPFKFFDNDNFFAPFASGSSRYSGMIICPCTMGTMGRIANGVADDLISRTADVMMKERRKLIMVIRETPYNLIHIENMKKITLSGGIIMPANPSFYSKPKTINDIVKTITDRALSISGFEINSFEWGE